MIKKVFSNIFLSYIKNEWVPLRWINLFSKKQRCDTKRAKDYYENNKERLRGQSSDKYSNLSKEEKNKKREYGKTDTTICLKKKNKD